MWGLTIPIGNLRTFPVIISIGMPIGAPSAHFLVSTATGYSILIITFCRTPWTLTRAVSLISTTTWATSTNRSSTAPRWPSTPPTRCIPSTIKSPACWWRSSRPLHYKREVNTTYKRDPRKQAVTHFDFQDIVASNTTTMHFVIRIISITATLILHKSKTFSRAIWSG